MIRNETNSGAPARFMAVTDRDKGKLCGKSKEICQVNAIKILNEKKTMNVHKCIGCGLCVSRCPEGACYMTPRKKYPKILRDGDALYNKVGREAVVGNIKRKVFGG